MSKREALSEYVVRDQQADQEDNLTWEDIAAAETAEEATAIPKQKAAPGRCLSLTPDGGST